MNIEFYSDESQKTIKPELYSTIADDLAKTLAKEQESVRGVNKRTQLRKFYDEVVRLDADAKTHTDNWEDILPAIHMLSAKAAYAKGRTLVSDTFLEFMQTCIKKIDTPRDLQTFANLFEAVMGFYRLHGPSS